MANARKIQTLTAAQEADLSAYRERARAAGIRTDWATEAQIRDAVLRLYAARGLSEPRVLVFDDPVQCLMARAILEDQLGSQLWAQLGGQLGSQLWDHLKGQLWGQLGDQLEGQLWEQLWKQLWGQLGGQLWGQLRDHLGGHLGDQLFQSTWFAGGSELYWIAFYTFAETIGVTYTTEQSASLAAWDNYATTCGPLYPYDGLAFVSRRPDLLAFDDARRLHSETGPAMRFPSGYAIHSWHGTRVPAEWIEHRDTIDPAEIIAVENVEMRAVGAQIVGWPRMMSALACKVIDHDPDPARGDLIEMTLPGLPEPGRFLRAECPRNGTIVEGVPRVNELDGSPINTVLAAQAWRVFETPATFAYPEIRT